jgi:AraC family ethanolamine operon transcriptional activator
VQSDASSPLFPAGAVINSEAEGFEQAASVAVKWNVETTQLQKGTYRFSTRAVHTPALQLGRTWRSLGTRLGGAIPQGTVVLAFALNPGARVQFRGRQVQAGEMIVQEDTCGLDFSFMDEIDVVTVAVSREELDRQAMCLWQKPFPVRSRTGILSFSGIGSLDRAGQGLTSMLEEALEEPGRLAEPARALALENAALDGLLGQLEDHCKAAGSVDRHKVARRAAAILHDRCREDLSMADLCEAVFANRRTLHLGFLELYGIPPMKYLCALRLCRVRRAIMDARDPDVRVTDVAMTWGFSHLGRFSASYRSFFGELPSADRILAAPDARPCCDILWRS